MSIDYQVQQKIYRLETLRRYQAYYGPNTPYQIVAEINMLEGELRRMLQAELTKVNRPVRPAQKRTPAKNRAGPGSRTGRPKPQSAASSKRGGKAASKREAKARSVFGLSKTTLDIITIISFIGFVFLLGCIVFATYLYTRSVAPPAFAQFETAPDSQPALRPTFTPTADPNHPAPVYAEASASDVIEVAAIEDSNLPSAHREPTPVPTAVPTLTPSPVSFPTETPTLVPTETPVPPPVQPPVPKAPPPTATPSEPTPTPAPQYKFMLREQGNREFQRTTNNLITVYVAIVSAGNVPVGGYKVVGDHSSGMHLESTLSDWNWSATNCLDCDYIKFGNVKFEPGPFGDGVWNIYVADEAGTQLSPVVPLPYSANPEQWVWDFIIFAEAE